MSWTVEVAPAAARQIRKLDPAVRLRVRRFLESLEGDDDPRRSGTALSGSSLWRYRTGDWRIVVSIEDTRLVVLVVEVGHRREVYR